MNIYTLPLEGGDVTVVIDLAHNEAGLEALLEIIRGRAPGARLLLGLGAAGDRTDESSQALGEIAGAGADHVVVAHKAKYLRGRTIDEIDGTCASALARVGVGDVESYATELDGLVAWSSPPRRRRLARYVPRRARSRGGWPHAAARPSTTRARSAARSSRARGEHELEDEIAELWSMPDDAARVAAADRLAARTPTTLGSCSSWPAPTTRR